MKACIIHIEDRTHEVPIITGAPEILVQQRELRNVYQTNRLVKVWASWFLLKAISPESSKISNWISQRKLILPFLQLNENTFRRQLSSMVELGIATIDDDYSITLCSYKTAADVLGIAYTGLTNIYYNPVKHNGKQIFRYFITAEEFRYQQQRQLNALLYHLDKNPLLKNDLHLLMVKYGADGQQLQKSAAYYQERLLRLQMQLFKEGSDILSHVMTHRADINRGVNRIKENHSYKSTQSACYLKKVMAKLNIIAIAKKKVESAARARIYIPEGDRKKDGYKYCKRTKQTVWFLTDQISFAYEATTRKTRQGEKRKAA
jgi:hypothetical protein